MIDADTYLVQGRLTKKFHKPSPTQVRLLAPEPTAKNGNPCATPGTETLLFKHFYRTHRAEVIAIVPGDHRETYRFVPPFNYELEPWKLRTRLVSVKDRKTPMYLNAHVDEEGTLWPQTD